MVLFKKYHQLTLLFGYHFLTIMLKNLTMYKTDIIIYCVVLCNFLPGKELIFLKRFIISFIFMLTFVILCATNANATDYNNIKVGLFYGSSAKSSVTISADGGISYGSHTGSSHLEAGRLEGNEFTIAATSATQITINNTLTIETGGSNLSIKPLGGNLRLNGKGYRGGIILTNSSQSAMDVINVLSLEEYLYGVVPNESPASWPADALKAQAVCARGFAVSNINKHASLGFNVCATTNCQVYGGLDSECSSTNAAVDATRGQVVIYDGKPIESLFYSSSGGHTANSKNVWGTSISYLCGVPDPYEPENIPNHSWSVTLSLEEIRNALATSGINIGNVMKLDAKTAEDGRTYELTITGSNGTRTLTKTNTYAPFYSSGVKGQKFTIVPVSAQDEPLYAANVYGNSRVAGNSVISAHGNIDSVSTNFYVITADGMHHYTKGEPVAYTFTGGGWGHGVGLSQYGSMGMANAGFSYADILAHYYPGTKLGSIY